MNTDEYKSIQVGQVLMYKTEHIDCLHLTKSYYKYHSISAQCQMLGWETGAYWTRKTGVIDIGMHKTKPRICKLGI